MDACRELLAQGAPEFSVVVADEQTAGRGRSAHSWHSPAGAGLYLSVLLFPRLPAQQGAWLTMIGALAVLDALRAYAPHLAVGCGIKWFNDVLYGERKLAGVLVEAQIGGPQLTRIDHAIVGIGINVNTVFDGAPPEVQARATSLHTVLGTQQDRERLLALLLPLFKARYARAQAGTSPVDDYRRQVRTIGRQVRVRVGDAFVAGIAERINDDGGLVVRDAAGEHVVSAGELL